MRRNIYTRKGIIYQQPGPTPRQPGANTLAYYPLTNTTQLSDQSGNNRDLTGTGIYSFGTYGGVDCCYINVGMLNSAIPQTYASAGITYNIRYYEVSAPNYDNGTIFGFNHNSGESADNDAIRCLRANGWPNSYDGIIGYFQDGLDNYSTTPYSITSGTWYNVCITFSGTTISLYINGTLQATSSGSITYDDMNYIQISRIGEFFERSIIGYVSNAIFEDKQWINQEISDYFNQTKSLYGIN